MNEEMIKDFIKNTEKLIGTKFIIPNTGYNKDISLSVLSINFKLDKCIYCFKQKINNIEIISKETCSLVEIKSWLSYRKHILKVEQGKTIII